MRGNPTLLGAARLWPTPSANLFECDPEVWKARREKHKARGINGNGFGLTLSMAVQEAELIERGDWPTPTARLGTPRGAQAKRYTDPARSVDLDDAVAYHGDLGPLNPTWVEWLMGFPLGWTASEPSETPSSPPAPSTSDDS